MEKNLKLRNPGLKACETAALRSCHFALLRARFDLSETFGLFSPQGNCWFILAHYLACFRARMVGVNFCSSVSFFKFRIFFIAFDTFALHLTTLE